MTRIISPNCTIVSLLCFLGFLFSVAAQTPDTTDTNQTPAENINIDTNALVNPPPAVPPAVVPIVPTPALYGAQPPAGYLLQTTPYQFETQNNVPVLAGPVYAGLGQIGSPQMGTATFSGGGSGTFAPSTGPGIYTGGKLQVHMSLGYSFAYATGVEPQPGQHTSVISQSLSPSITAILGPHWTLSYSASLPSYSSGSGFNDTIGQAAVLSGSTIYNGWSLGLTESYSFTDAALVQTAAQTREEAYATSLSVSHSLGQDFSFAIGLSQSTSEAEQLNNVYSWGGSGSLNYILNPKVTVGADVSVSYSPVSVGPTVTSESYMGVLMVRLGSKATLNLSGGIEESTFEGSGIPSEVTPTFSAGLTYQLTHTTTLTVNASRSLSPSYFFNQVSTSTSVGASLGRSLTPKLSLSISGNYYVTSYDVITPGEVSYGAGTIPTIATSYLETARNDHGSGIGASLSYAFRARLNASISYAWSANSSSDSDFTYTSTQISLGLSYQY